MEKETTLIHAGPVLCHKNCQSRAVVFLTGEITNYFYHYLATNKNCPYRTTTCSLFCHRFMFSFHLYRIFMTTSKKEKK